VVAGQTNKSIGIDLGISIKTVEKHRQAVHQKTNTHSLSELIRLHFTSEQPLEAAYGLLNSGLPDASPTEDRPLPAV